MSSFSKKISVPENNVKNMNTPHLVSTLSFFILKNPANAGFFKNIKEKRIESSKC